MIKYYILPPFPRFPLPPPPSKKWQVPKKQDCQDLCQAGKKVEKFDGKYFMCKLRFLFIIGDGNGGGV